MVRQGHTGKPITNLALAAVFLMTAEVALSYAESQAPKPIRNLQVSDLIVPEELGYVIERHPPTGSPAAPVVIHIQEAHTNYEGQKHLAAILERLIEEYGLTLILVEGSEGDVSLAYLRSYGGQENRRQVAEKYLKAGLLSGEEYLDFVSDAPLILWGVEEKTVYDEHVELFLETEALRTSVMPILDPVRAAGEALKPRLFDPALTRLEEQASAFETEELGLGAYVDFVGNLAKRHGVGAEGYPNLARFLRVRRLEEQFEPSQVQEEQQRLVGQLSQRVDQAQMEGLIEQAHQLKAGKVTRQEFYASLETLATTSGVLLDLYPNLAHYIRYVKGRAAIRPTGLAGELDQLAARLRDELTSTPASRQLSAILQEVDLVEKLLMSRLTPEEYRRVKALQVNTLAPRWSAFFQEQFHAQGWPAPSFPGLDALGRAVPKTQRFYQIAGKRDQVLVDKTIAKLNETGEPLAVLITGGFHSPQIIQRLTEAGLGVIVVAPKVSQATDERLYHAVLKYKSGHGSLEEVMAIAGEATP